MEKRMVLLGTALAALSLASGCTKGHKGDQASAGKGECWGVNGCKGQGECGGKGHACAGKNACKGEGWLGLSKDECEKKGGKFKEG